MCELSVCVCVFMYINMPQPIVCVIHVLLQRQPTLVSPRVHLAASLRAVEHDVL